MFEDLVENLEPIDTVINLNLSLTISIHTNTIPTQNLKKQSAVRWRLCADTTTSVCLDKHQA